MSEPNLPLPTDQGAELLFELHLPVVDQNNTSIDLGNLRILSGPFTDILEDVEIDGSFAFTNVEEVNDLNCAG